MSATAKISREISFRGLDRREDIVAREQIKYLSFAGILGLILQMPMYACPNRVFTPRSRAEVVNRSRVRSDGEVRVIRPEMHDLREVVR